MPERPFICITSAILYDDGLNSVSEGAETLFRRMDQCSDRYGRFSTDLDIIKGECFAKRKEVTAEIIEDRIKELLAVGAIKFCTSRDGSRFIQINERLRYKQDAVNKPRWGDADEAAEQTEFKMPVEVSLPPAKTTRAATRNKMREEKTNNLSNINNDSDASDTTPTPEIVNNSETRAGSAGNDSGEVQKPPKLIFELPPDAESEPLPKKPQGSAKRSDEDQAIARIGHLCGDKERIENGGIWRNRYRANPFAVNEALGDLQLRLASGKEGPVKNKGAWLTDKFIEISQARKRA